MLKASARAVKTLFTGAPGGPVKAIGGMIDAARPERARWRTAASAYADDAWVDAQLARQASFSSLYDARACAALFLASYAPRVSMVMASIWVRRQQLPLLQPEHVRLRTALRLHLDHLKPRLSRRLVFSVDRIELLPDRAESLLALRQGIEAHFEPLIGVLASKNGISRQALWRLVGDAVSQAFLEAGRRSRCEEQATADAMILLKQVGSPLNNRQLGYFKVSVSDPVRAGSVFTRTFRQRGGCCRYYTAFPGQLCSTCVLKDPVERDRAFEARLLRRLALRRLPERLYRHAKNRVFRTIHPGSGHSSGGL